MEQKAIILDDQAMLRAIARISYEIIEKNKGASNLALIGILTRGVSLAERIAAKIEEVEGICVPTGTLDITPFRDDREVPDEYVDRTDISFDVTGKNLILVDDVLFTGRSARAAIESVMNKGRAQSIQLAVLIDRGHRELPIRPDYVGKNVPTSKEETVVVTMKEEDGEDKVSIFQSEEGDF